MYNIAFRITGNQYEAEDVLQEAFINAFKSIKSFRYASSFGAWLKRIVVNQAVNHMKKKRVELTPLLAQDDQIKDEETESHSERLDRQVSVEKIKKAMHQLPDGYRMVFSLYLLEGYDHNEIAQIMDITVSTSKSQYNRAKKKLKLIVEAL